MDQRPSKEEVEKIVRAVADQGLLIEAGWKGYRLLVIPLQAGAVQIEECRIAFYAGCQQLFGSLTGQGNILDEGQEPTDHDMRRMSLIASELDAFLIDFKKRHPVFNQPEDPPQGKPS